MRVTAEVQAETRQRILAVAQQLFVAEGFEATTTRDIAAAAEIAVGTMFNYFPSKEAVLEVLASEALALAHEEFAKGKREGESLQEDLFAYVAAGLRKLKPLRKNLPVVFLSPANAPGNAHLAVVAQLARRHGFNDLPPMAAQMYWSLYAGLISFWAADASPRQEDTLALLDDSMEMFASWLTVRLKTSDRASTP